MELLAPGDVGATERSGATNAGPMHIGASPQTTGATMQQLFGNHLGRHDTGNHVDALRAPIQAKQPGLAGLTPQDQRTSSAGAALPVDVRAKMETAFGADFSNVRVHEASPVQAGALAYTQGSDIHFAPGQYQPHSTTGQELLGHELAHVVQQAQGKVAATIQAKGTAINDDPALEQEADLLGTAAARGASARSAHASTQVRSAPTAGPIQFAFTIETVGTYGSRRVVAVDETLASILRDTYHASPQAIAWLRARAEEVSLGETDERRFTDWPAAVAVAESEAARQPLEPRGEGPPGGDLYGEGRPGGDLYGEGRPGGEPHGEGPRGGELHRPVSPRGEDAAPTFRKRKGAPAGTRRKAATSAALEKTATDDDAAVPAGPPKRPRSRATKESIDRYRKEEILDSEVGKHLGAALGAGELGRDRVEVLLDCGLTLEAIGLLMNGDTSKLKLCFDRELHIEATLGVSRASISARTIRLLVPDRCTPRVFGALLEAGMSREDGVALEGVTAQWSALMALKPGPALAFLRRIDRKAAAIEHYGLDFLCDFDAQAGVADLVEHVTAPGTVNPQTNEISGAHTASQWAGIKGAVSAYKEIVYHFGKPQTSDGVTVWTYHAEVGFSNRYPSSGSFTKTVYEDRLLTYESIHHVLWSAVTRLQYPIGGRSRLRVQGRDWTITTDGLRAKQLW